MVLANCQSEEWAEAWSRVESYFLLLGVRAASIRQRLVWQVMERAARRFDQQPPASLTGLAMEEAERVLAAWFEDVLPESAPDADGAVSVQGRAALLLADAPKRWPEQVLRPGPWPQGFVTTLRQALWRAHPDRRPTRMTPHPLDFGRVTRLAQFAEQPQFLRAALGTAAAMLFGLLWFCVL